MQQHFAHLFATPKAITLAGITLAPRNPDGTFAVAGREKQIHAQLQAAYGRTVSPQAIGYIRRGCELLALASDEELENAAYPFHPNPHATATSGNDFPVVAKGLMMFALTGLGDMENIAQGKARLLKMQATTHGDALLKSYGLPTWEELTKDDGDDEEEDEDDDQDGEGDDSDDSGASTGGGNGHYNPDEPRIPAGQTGGGQWTTGDGTTTDSGSTSADDVRTALREDFDNYKPAALPQGTQVATNDVAQSDANPTVVSTTPTTQPASNLTLSDQGLDFLTQHESFNPNVYQDTAGYDTIGYGHRLTDGESYPDGITQEQGAQLLAQDTATAQAAVRNNVTAPLTQNQYDALVSFAYNVGATAFANSTLVQNLNDGDTAAAADQFANWTQRRTRQGTHVVDSGLVNRRSAERDLFLNGNY